MRKSTGLVIVNQGMVVKFGEATRDQAIQLFALVHHSSENHKLKGSPRSGDQT